MSRRGTSDYLKNTLKCLRKADVDTMLWVNGPVSDENAAGHVWMHQHPFNVGQHVAHNSMLDECVKRGYDWHVRVDDDFSTRSTNWPKRMVALEKKTIKKQGTGMILGMTVDGLKNPPQSMGKWILSGEHVEQVAILGGIFRFSPMSILRYFRWDERLPMGMGEARQFANYCDSINVKMARMMKIRCSHGGSTREQESADPDWAYEHDMLQFTPLGL